MADAHDEHRRQVAALHNAYLRQLAEADPTLTRLKAALEEERRWQTMTRVELLAVVTQLEAKYKHLEGPPRGTA